MIEASIDGFASTNPNDVIKKMVIETKKVVDLKSKEGKEKRTKVIYNIVLKVTDSSSKDFANVYFVSQEYGSHAFDSWKILPTLDDNEGWKNIKDTKLAEFEKKLNSLKSEDKKVALCVEVAVSKNGKSFARLVDTVFTN